MAEIPSIAGNDCVPRFCVDCSAPISTHVYNEVRCRPCQNKARAQAGRRWRERQKAKNAEAWRAKQRASNQRYYTANREKICAALRKEFPRSSTDYVRPIVCIDCGASARRVSANQKRCGPCTVLHRAQIKRAWNEENKPRIREQQSRRRQDNKLSRNMSNAVRLALKGNKAGRSWETLVDYGLEQLRAHIERQFTRGMDWENYGEWEIDHITPIVSFKFSQPEDAAFQACWALSNLRPLWRTQNRRKQGTRVYLI